MYNSLFFFSIVMSSVYQRSVLFMVCVHAALQGLHKLKLLDICLPPTKQQQQLTTYKIFKAINAFFEHVNPPHIFAFLLLFHSCCCCYFLLSILSLFCLSSLIFGVSLLLLLITICCYCGFQHHQSNHFRLLSSSTCKFKKQHFFCCYQKSLC